jgi:hypothetical protein
VFLICEQLMVSQKVKEYLNKLSRLLTNHYNHHLFFKIYKRNSYYIIYVDNLRKYARGLRIEEVVDYNS